MMKAIVTSLPFRELLLPSAGLTSIRGWSIFYKVEILGSEYLSVLLLTLVVVYRQNS